MVGEGTLEVWVRDQGPGFDPDDVPDPVAEENLLKAYGRGIFFMRSFMDEVEYAFPQGGGTLVRMLKRAQAPEPAGEASP
jgi:serine/threonine-protein kinase RsbW